MTDKYTFLLSYFELVSTLEFSLENFTLMAEEELEEKIKEYLMGNHTHSRLLYWEMDGENQTERDVFHQIRPSPDNSYLYFEEELCSTQLLESEDQSIAIAEKIGTTSFHLLKNGHRLAVFIKQHEQWFWLPFHCLSKMPNFQSPLMPLSEIHQGDQFFTMLLKT
ncbi:hypothetical protein [Candidatus Enterococcus leclercqii]|uniref:hypothetical protein n=1 Tax=Candidatus Enterococcus leclercqii TaxID=1857218 RepID=UPI00137A7C6E|nr:hypothetical protein [Enterococcus sp. CU9D]KAF1294150.1 hypothetical protein BAU14_07110 [Enterococcus sp. CU9D]